jgi:hypothetical protein
LVSAALSPRPDTIATPPTRAVRHGNSARWMQSHDFGLPAGLLDDPGSSAAGHEHLIAADRQPAGPPLRLGHEHTRRADGDVVDVRARSGNRSVVKDDKRRRQASE